MQESHRFAGANLLAGGIIVEEGFMRKMGQTIRLVLIWLGAAVMASAGLPAWPSGRAAPAVGAVGAGGDHVAMGVKGEVRAETAGDPESAREVVRGRSTRSGAGFEGLVAVRSKSRSTPGPASLRHPAARAGDATDLTATARHLSTTDAGFPQRPAERLAHLQRFLL